MNADTLRHIARATGWAHKTSHGGLFMDRRGAIDKHRWPFSLPADALAALKATGCGWRIDAGIPRDELMEVYILYIYPGMGTPIRGCDKSLCAAACEALAAYGKALGEKEGRSNG